MATIETPKFGNDQCPVMRLTIDPETNGATSYIARWKIFYVAPKPVNTGGAGRRYVAKINGNVVVDKTYNVDQKTGTIQLDTGTVTIAKTKATQTISASISATWNFSWNGVKASTKTGTGSFSVPALTSYSINYNANGGSGAPSKQTKLAGTNITLSTAKPTRTGYLFKGWATTSGGGVAYNPGSTYSANASITLYAVWSVIKYTISYDANGGSGAPAAQSKTHGTDLKLSTTVPTRANYNFAGWAGSADGAVIKQPGDMHTGNANYKYYAIWTLAYIPPRITSASADRCDSAGNLTETGQYALIKFNWATDKPITGLNISWRLAGTTSNIGTLNVGATGTSGTVSQVIGGNALAHDKTYTVKITATDAGDSKWNEVTVNAIEYLIDFLSGGKGVAFGKPAENANQMDIQYPINVRSKFVSPLRKDVEASAWILGRDSAFIKVTGGTASGFSAAVSQKTPVGDWSIGTLNEDLYMAYSTDTDYKANTNAVNSLTFYKNGGLKSSWARIGSSNITNSAIDFKSTGNVTINESKHVSTLEWLNDFWGMAGPANHAINYIRSPLKGIIPYDTTGTNSSLGSPSWNFKDGYFKNVYINNKNHSENQVLCTPNLYMDATHVANFEAPVSSLSHGVVLTFCRYADKLYYEQQHSFFVPKKHILDHPGTGHTFFFAHAGGFGIIGAKYIYISNTQAKGNAVNITSGTKSGITFNNKNYVLHRVYGV